MRMLGFLSFSQSRFLEMDIILNTEKCIDSILLSTYNKYKIIIVDNNSKDSTISYIEKLINIKYVNRKIHLIKKIFQKEIHCINKWYKN